MCAAPAGRVLHPGPELIMDASKSFKLKSAFKVHLRPRTLGGVKGTEIEISGPDVAGLLACITGGLFARGYDVLSTKGETLSGGGPMKIKDTFVVTKRASAGLDPTTSGSRPALYHS